MTGKAVYFYIFNQYDNNSHTNDLTDIDQLPKDATEDTSKIRVMMSLIDIYGEVYRGNYYSTCVLLLKPQII
ncbi:hypothetical protein M1857_15930 (plasmid) [Lactiplantibacillus plantarum]|nr:hypothetical protein M1857_15930 [Lactiplantibacillus plantarum]